MVFAQRFPAQFDGILAAAPAFAVPKAALAEAWDTQVFSALARQQGRVGPSGLPDMSQTFTPAQLERAATAVLAACDASDGLRDDMVQRVDACSTTVVEPALRRVQCADASCLSRAQVDALITSFDGPHDSTGTALYAAWPWDSGIATDGWRIWKIGIPGQMPAINVVLGAAALSGLFVTPPDVVAAAPDALQQYQLDFNFDEDAPRIFATAPGFPRSSWDLVGAQATDLTAFRKRGGRMLVPHGGSDPIFSLADTIEWWQRVDLAQRGEARDFVRVFAVPGMTHCEDGRATGEFDALGALVDWVERGKAPERIEARAGPATPWPGRSRPLCAYPKYARYTGGDTESAHSFECVAAQ
jgi:Tannase and feruloyl esterase